METFELVKEVAKALDDKKAFDVTVLDIREVSVMADYFIVASADNQNMLMSLQRETEEVMAKNGINCKSVEGNRSSTWILLDFEDIIVHLFMEEDRTFYDLERIWKDGKQLRLGDL